MQADATGMLQMAIDATQSGISLGVLCKRWPLGTAQMGYVQHILPRQGKNERPAAKAFICSRTASHSAASRASEGRFHARPVIFRQKAAICHGNAGGRHRGLATAKAARPLLARTAGSCAGLASPRPLRRQTPSFIRKAACCASGRHRGPRKNRPGLSFHRRFLLLAYEYQHHPSFNPSSLASGPRAAHTPAAKPAKGQT